MTVLSFGVDPLSTWKSVFGEESDTVDFGRTFAFMKKAKCHRLTFGCWD